MDDKIYFLTKELKEEMDKDPRFKLLLSIEEKMNNNEEVIRLAIAKDKANERYNDLLKIYPEENELVVSAKKELFLAKKELDSHPLVKEYLSAYKEVEMLLYEVNQILFKEFRGEC